MKNVKKINQKILASLMLAILIISSFAGIVQADTIINEAYLYPDGHTGKIIYYKGQSSGATYTVYNHNGNLYPAYCLNDGVDGPGEAGGYNCSVSEMSTDSRVWRVMRYGYPYSDPSSMGVQNNLEAFYVTKHAIYCVTGQRNVADYTAMAGKEHVLTALQRLVAIGFDEGYGSYQSPSANINKQGELTLETIDGVNYYVQNFNVTSTLDFADYNIATTGLPEGSKILNISNQEQNQFTGTQEFKIVVPEEQLTQDISSYIAVDNVQMKTYPILYGASNNPSLQNHCLATDPYEIGRTMTNLNIELTKPKIVKTERGTEDRLPGAKYNIYKDENEDGKYDEGEELVKEVGPTDENGEILVTDLPIGKFVAVETVAPEGYNLDSDHLPFEVNPYTKDVTLESKDTVITSTLQINKLAKDDNQITGNKKGEPLKNALFNIYDINHKLLYENAKTDENGQINVVLRYGKYIVEEVRPPEFYLLNEGEGANEQIINVHKQGELIPLTFEDTSVKLGLVIEKTGIVQCQKNDEIVYNFPQLKNDSNVALDNFTWTDVLPTEYIRATKLYTGTFNEDLRYEVYYKTNLSGDTFRQYKNEKEEDGKFSTLTNNYIDLSKINTNEEYITEWKIEFGTVKAGFSAEEKPFMFAKVLDTVKADDKWTNNTYLFGDYTSIDGNKVPLGSKDDWTTTSYEKKLSISRLPKTGF